jgi:hypothetical protein
VELPYPQSQMNRSDPANEEDGMGTALISLSLDGGFVGTVQYEPFGDSLDSFMKSGFKV